MRPADTPLTLELTRFTLDGGVLELVYVAQNEGSHRLFLVNRLLRRTTEGLRPDPDLVYARIRPGPVLDLSKQLIPVPGDVDVEVPEVPALTPVAAGEGFTETVRIPVPVGPYDPYTPQPSGGGLTEVGHCTWTLGYVVEDQPGAASEQELATGGRAWRMDYGDVARGQRTRRIDVHDAGVPTTIDLDGP